MHLRIRSKLHTGVEILLLLFIAFFAFYVNREIRIRGLYMDDLYMWSCYGEQSLLEFAFPIGTSTRFRPVYWLATYLQMMIVGTHITRFVTFNILCNLAVAYVLYAFAKELSDCKFVSAMTAVLYLASRFAYYQIGQALGLMETMALLMAVLILHCIYRLVTRERPLYLWAAVILYFLLAFTHERYISLFPLLYLGLFLFCLHLPSKDRRHWLRQHRGLIAAPMAALVLIVLIRSLAIGKALPAGTGGTEVTDTFQISQALRFACSQVLYIFGVNDGPEHLNGLPWADTPPEIRRMVKYSVLMIGLICILFFLLVVKEILGVLKVKRQQRAGSGEENFFTAATDQSWPYDYKKALREHLEVSILFAVFIGLCIGCSSVTIRVEMRWIYVSYAAALLYASYMIGEISEGFRLPRERKTQHLRGDADITLMRVLVTVLFAAYMVLSVRTNLYYRTWYPKLYFWPDQLRMNSLAEETIEKYGTEGVFGKDIYILENSYGMSDFYARTFFKIFDEDKKAEGTRVIFAGDIEQIPKADVRAGKALVLREIPGDNAYLDITDTFD